MKIILKTTAIILSAILIASSVYVYIYRAQGREDINYSAITDEQINKVLQNQYINTSSSKNKKQGRIKVTSLYKETQMPIENVIYVIIDDKANEIVEVLVTDGAGTATSRLYDYGKKYKIKQYSIGSPYKVNEEVIQIKINDKEHFLIIESDTLEYVKGFEVAEDGKVNITELFMPVEIIKQRPVLPNGCEITSLTAVLNYYGYDVTKTEMSDTYLPRRHFERIDGILYGGDPYKEYAGDPRDPLNGFFSYAPPIVEAAELYFKDIKEENKTPIDISGSSREEIMGFLESGVPVVIWTTLNLEKPRINYSWKLFETGDKFYAPINLHCIVLKGFVDDKVYVMDPLKGSITRNADDFFASYEALGSHAMVVINES
ncbi:uncharacterized protein YvpB [Natranaerovirga pectinivora]|uniref:Uncharacterized protein YvpB n=1 Tax=Natranaerovirga pectinivora TaxID=682400 RepID=A0A4R3MHA0_9FIRM|nr:C39 family peptidase [Natranaerovirga pectinivora]TCT12964.1 uncharacterized protein YvpB [Natranaerovirga pectinivora]